MNGFNLSDIQDAKLGTTQLSSIYLGSIKLWESDPQLSEYFWIKYTSPGNMVLTVNGTLSDFSIQISTDKTSWSTYTFNSSIKQYSFLESTNMTYYIKGTNSSYATSTSNYFNIKFTSGSFITGGNIMSLIYGDNFKGHTTLSSNYTFNGLFKSAGYLTSAGDLRLPATTLVNYCYSSMFRGCTSLTSAPELPATTLANSCYLSMFNGCTSLSYIKCLATDISATNSHNFWVDGVASTGTFVKPASMTSWPSGTSGIPKGWTVIDI